MSTSLIINDIIKYLEKHGIYYWLDSGTLLGLARDGELFEWDNDIDISLRVDESAIEGVIEDIRRILTNRSYKGIVYKYRGLIYKIKGLRKNSKSIDVSFFRPFRDMLWCPQRYFKGESFTKRNFSYYLYGIWRFPIRKLYSSGIIKEIDGSKSIWGLTGNFGVWCFPQELIDKPITVDWAFGCVPNNWSEYLQSRYGNWKEPKRNWEYLRDDATFKRKTPSTFWANYE